MDCPNSADSLVPALPRIEVWAAKASGRPYLLKNGRTKIRSANAAHYVKLAPVATRSSIAINRILESMRE
jgi:hypothetical protein